MKLQNYIYWIFIYKSIFICDIYFISFYFDIILAKSTPTHHKIYLDIKANCNNHECRRSMNMLFQIHQNLDFSEISSSYPCLWYLSWVLYSFAIISTLLDSVFIFNPFHTILVLLSLGLGNPFAFMSTSQNPNLIVGISLYKICEGEIWTLSEENILEDSYSVHLYQAQVFLLYFFSSIRKIEPFLSGILIEF